MPRYLPEVTVELRDEKEGLNIMGQLGARGAEFDTDYTGLYGQAWKLTGVLLMTPKALRLMADVLEKPPLPVEPDDDGYYLDDEEPDTVFDHADACTESWTRCPTRSGGIFRSTARPMIARAATRPG